jgi:hypothetical protein
VVPKFYKISEGVKIAAESSASGISFLMILIIVLVCLAFLFGGIEFFWNVMDLA